MDREVFAAGVKQGAAPRLTLLYNYCIILVEPFRMRTAVFVVQYQRYDVQVAMILLLLYYRDATPRPLGVSLFASCVRSKCSRCQA